MLACLHGGFVRVSAVHVAFCRDVCEDCGEFKDFGNIGLAVEDGFFRVEAAREPGADDFFCVFYKLGGIFYCCEGVVVGDEEEATGLDCFVASQ